MANSLISGGAYFNIRIMEYAFINITNNTLQSSMFLAQNDHNYNFPIYSPCFFQFYQTFKKDKRNSTLLVLINRTQLKKFLVILQETLTADGTIIHYFMDKIRSQYTKNIFNSFSETLQYPYLPQDYSASVQTTCNTIAMQTT